jgi:PBP1b-binding outer membrane lipoprotein LpoB
MKKVKMFLVIALVAMLFSSCATVFGGHISDYQKTKPASGQAKRQLRPVPFVLDCFVPIGLIIDFADGAIYKPQQTK